MASSFLLHHILRDYQLNKNWQNKNFPKSCEDVDFRIKAGVDWLIRSIEATQNQGSSKGFSYSSGWMPAYPETSGYIISTLLNYSKTYNDPVSQKYAADLALWLKTKHNEDGGIPPISNQLSPSFVFDSGMVLQGYVDLYETTKDEEVGDLARRCAHFLVNTQNVDGSWSNCYNNIPHAYHARVSWPLLKYSLIFSDEKARYSACANLGWVIAQQNNEGFWQNAFFTPKIPYANTHSIGYILEGFLESYLLLGEERWLNSAKKAADKVLKIATTQKGYLPAYFNASWKEQKVMPFSFACLTGIAQIARSFYLLYKITSYKEYLTAANLEIDFVTQYQELEIQADGIRGALPGAGPFWGRYLPFQFPNWATKFLIDALFEKRLLIKDSFLPVFQPGSIG